MADLAAFGSPVTLGPTWHQLLAKQTTGAQLGLLSALHQALRDAA